MQSFGVRADVDENGNWNWTSVVGDTEQYGSKYTFGIDPEEQSRCGYTCGAAFSISANTTMKKLQLRTLCSEKLPSLTQFKRL